MELGISYQCNGSYSHPAYMLPFVQRAEALGFATLSLTDHLILPREIPSSYPYHPQGRYDWRQKLDFNEPLVTLAWLAGQTARIRLGTSVLILPYRNPIATAKQLATTDWLSGGRLFLGVGTGWWEREFEVLGIGDHFADRGPRTDEYLRVMQTLWREPDPAFEGRYHRFSNVEFSPRPAQPTGLPVWIGGKGPRVLRRTAELGDIWHPVVGRPPSDFPPEEMQTALRRLRELADEHGRAPGAVGAVMRCLVEFAPEPEGRFKGPPAHIVESLQAYEAVGGGGALIDVPMDDPERNREHLERLGAEVLPWLGG